MHITNTEVGSSIRDNMMIMSLEVITNRALPILEDGFKPSQRKGLYTMKTMNLFNKLAKSANITGQVMKIHPHSTLYGSLVRMTRENETLLTPFINGKGSFGKVYSSSMEPAAERYTEMSLAPICHEMMDKLYMHPENMVDNYDGTMKEPVLLSMPFPNILANPQSGIGIGFACDFPSFNLAELCDACIAVLNGNKNIREIMPVPDFSTGAYVLYKDEDVAEIFENGSGKVTLRAKLSIDKENNVINVDEIPYNTTAESIIDSIQKCYDKGQFPEILDVKDEIGIDGFRVSIEHKRSADVKALINKLYLLTPLQSTFSCNMTLVYNNRPAKMGVYEIIDKWIEHRKAWVQDEINFEIAEKEDKLHLLKGLAQILLNIDKAVEIVKGSKSDDEVISGLMSEFSIDDIQAEYVANIKLRNFNEEYVLNRTKEITELEKAIKKLKKTKPIDVMVDDLNRVRDTYGIPRKTEILTEWEEVKPLAKEKKEVKIDGTSTLFIGKDIRRVNGESRAKTPDHCEKIVVDNRDSILLFTNKGRCFKIFVHKIKPNITHEFEGGLVKFKELEMGEQIIAKIPLTKETKSKTLFIVYDKKVARIPLDGFDNSRRLMSKGIRPDAVDVRLVDDDEIFEVNGQMFNTSQYSITKNRLAQGVNIRKFVSE